AQYIDIRLRLFKLNLIEQVSGILGYLILTFIALFVCMSVLIFFGLGLAEYLVDVLDSRSGAYFLTGGIFILLFFLLFVFKKFIVRIISSVFISIITEKKDDDEDDDNDSRKEEENY